MRQVSLSLAPRPAYIRSVKYDGALNYEWPITVVWEDAGGFIWHAPRGAPFTRPTGAWSLEYDWVGRIWYGRWYMVDGSLVPADAASPAGVLHHYYCNIGAPGAWVGDRYRFVDLDLDVWVHPDGSHRLLDEDELALHSAHYGYPAGTVAAVRRAADDVVALVGAGAPPFEGTLAAYHAALYG
jgi:hypothetical protein